MYIYKKHRTVQVIAMSPWQLFQWSARWIRVWKHVSETKGSLRRSQIEWAWMHVAVNALPWLHEFKSVDYWEKESNDTYLYCSSARPSQHSLKFALFATCPTLEPTFSTHIWTWGSWQSLHFDDARLHKPRYDEHAQQHRKKKEEAHSLIGYRFDRLCRSRRVEVIDLKLRLAHGAGWTWMSGGREDESHYEFMRQSLGRYRKDEGEKREGLH
jgi:hypothetical protein